MQLDEDGLKWRQRAKQHWLKQGDKNIKFFHLNATKRRKTNMIVKICDQNGIIEMNQEQIGGALLYLAVYII